MSPFGRCRSRPDPRSTSLDAVWIGACARSVRPSPSSGQPFGLRPSRILLAPRARRAARWLTRHGRVACVRRTRAPWLHIGGAWRWALCRALLGCRRGDAEKAGAETKRSARRRKRAGDRSRAPASRPCAGSSTSSPGPSGAIWPTSCRSARNAFGRRVRCAAVPRARAQRRRVRRHRTPPTPWTSSATTRPTRRTMTAPVGRSTTDPSTSCLPTETLEHVKEPDRFLDEAYRCLRGGGRLILTVRSPRAGTSYRRITGGSRRPACCIC